MRMGGDRYQVLIVWAIGVRLFSVPRAFVRVTYWTRVGLPSGGGAVARD